MRGLFITGTDTGVGKTLVTALLARFLADRGRRVGVMKPVETGVAELPPGSSDAERLLWAARSPLPVAAVSPWRLPAPLAPLTAAADAGVDLDYDALRQQARILAAQHDLLLVEGAGGLLVPLAPGRLMRDLARDLDLPLLVVSRPQLGSLNHSLLTLEAAEHGGLKVLGLVANRMPAVPNRAAATLLETLRPFTKARLFGALPACDRPFEQQVETLLQQEDTQDILTSILNALSPEAA